MALSSASPMLTPGYVRGSVSAQRNAEFHVLYHVEEAFRMAKTNLEARPMFHRTEGTIKAHLTTGITATTAKPPASYHP